MGMIGIVTMTTLKLVRFSDVYKNLSLTTAEVKGAIRTAQTLALSPPVISSVEHICGFGVRNSDGNKKYLEIFYAEADDVKTCRLLDDIGEVCGNVIYDGNTHPVSCDVYERKDFDGFEITQGDSGDAVKIFFRAPYGEVLGADNVIIQQLDEGGGAKDGYKREIEVNKHGKINVVSGGG